MAISLNSINKKLKAYEKSAYGKKAIQNRVLEYRKNGVRQTAAGSEILSPDKMEELASEFIVLLMMKAWAYSQVSPGDEGIPASVLNHFYSLYYKGPTEEDGVYNVRINFADDLSRKSFDDGLFGRTGDGIDNIVALFNNGYHASKHVYGWWENHRPIGIDTVYRSGQHDAKDAWTRSKKDREGLRFVQEAIDEFEAKYKKRYGITVLPGPYTG